MTRPRGLGGCRRPSRAPARDSTARLDGFLINPSSTVSVINGFRQRVSSTGFVNGFLTKSPRHQRFPNKVPRHQRLPNKLPPCHQRHTSLYKKSLSNSIKVPPNAHPPPPSSPNPPKTHTIMVRKESNLAPNYPKLTPSERILRGTCPDLGVTTEGNGTIMV